MTITKPPFIPNHLEILCVKMYVCLVIITFYHTQNLNTMKKLLLSFSLATFSLLAIATPPKKPTPEIYSYAAREGLKSMYGEVDNLHWVKSKDDMIRANFTIDGDAFSAFFDSEGKHVATTSEKTVAQLPAMIRKTVKARFDEKSIANIVQYESPVENAYFLEVEQDGGKKIYKVNSVGRISLFK